jgi:hypothetical protein
LRNFSPISPFRYRQHHRAIAGFEHGIGCLKQLGYSRRGVVLRHSIARVSKQQCTVFLAHSRVS